MGTPQLNIALHRKVEERLHQTLHKNLSILLLAYTPTVEFTNILKQGMFMKSNPNAFLHTAHFLLNIIDHGDFKSKFEWPLYEKRMETTFKNTFRSYLPEMNNKYPFIKLPPVKVSFMVTPGGFHFTTMMLKLSELAMIVYLKKNGKEVYIPSNEPSDLDDIKKVLKDKCDQIDQKLNFRVAYRNRFFKEAEKEVTMIENCIAVDKKKLETIKENWKQYILDVADLTDTEKKMLIDDPKKAISIMKSELLKLLEKNENLSKLLESKVKVYEEIDHLSNVLLERTEKSHCLQYDNNIKELCSLRKYVAEEYISVVERIVQKGKLNFPLLLNCLTSVFNEVAPLMPQQKVNKDAMISIQDNCAILKNVFAEFGKLNERVYFLSNELQRDLNRARSDFESRPEWDDSPVISSLNFLLPGSSPYRELKLHNDTNKEDSVMTSGSRSTSMFDISKLSDNSSNRAIVQPAWLNLNMMSVRKPKRKPLNKSNQHYQSSPCLTSPLVRNISRKQELNNSQENTGDKKGNLMDSVKSFHHKFPAMQREVQSTKLCDNFVIPIKSNIDNFVTPIKQCRKSIIPKWDEIIKRLSLVPDAMPRLTLNSCAIVSPRGDSDLHSPLGIKQTIDESVTNKFSTSYIVDEELLNDCLNSPLFENKYVESLVSGFSARPSKRYSMGLGENLLNVSSPIDLNYLLDSD